MTSPLTLQPAGADTFIYSYAPTTNNAAATSSYVGDPSSASSAKARILLKWDIAGAGIPAGSVITSVELKLYENDAGGAAGSRTLSVYRVLRAWTVDGVTYNKYDGTNNWGTAGCDNTTSDRSGTASASLTADEVAAADFLTWGSTQGLIDDVQGWLDGTVDNNGWILISSGESAGISAIKQNTFRLSENASTTSRPKLVIGYTEPSGATGFMTLNAGMW